MKRPYTIEVAGFHAGGRLATVDVYGATRSQAAARLDPLLHRAVVVALAMGGEGFINVTVYGTNGMLGGVTETKTARLDRNRLVGELVTELSGVLDGWDWSGS